MRVGLVNGALLALMALGFLGCYIHFFKAYAWGQAFLLSGCVGVSLIVAMVISSLVGTVIPMLFHKIHIDPAVASGPLITTINDLVAVVVYYGLAMIVLIDMLHLADFLNKSKGSGTAGAFLRLIGFRSSTAGSASHPRSQTSHLPVRRR